MKKPIRKLTISYSYNETQDSNRVPFIRLKGKWLNEAGFTLGKKIHVYTTDKKLVITVEESAEQEAVSAAVSDTKRVATPNL